MADHNTMPRSDIMRSPLGRARGLGAAREGAGEWWAQRLMSVALVPLTIWFVFAAIHLTGTSREQFAEWLSSPWRIALMIALIGATFHHLNMGLQVVIEDYVHHDATKMVAVVAQKGLCLFLGILCVAATLKIGLKL